MHSADVVSRGDIQRLKFRAEMCSAAYERASMDCAALHQLGILPRGEISRNSFLARRYTALSFSTPL